MKGELQKNEQGQSLECHSSESDPSLSSFNVLLPAVLFILLICPSAFCFVSRVALGRGERRRILIVSPG
jgi:hypothetical protein